LSHFHHWAKRQPDLVNFIRKGGFPGLCGCDVCEQLYADCRQAAEKWLAEYDFKDFNEAKRLKAFLSYQVTRNYPRPQDIAIGMVNSGYIQVRVSLRQPSSNIGLSVVFGQFENAAMFHFMLHPTETHILAGRLVRFASQPNSPSYRKNRRIKVRIVDDRVGFSIHVSERHGDAKVRFTLTRTETYRLADLLLEAMVRGGFISPENAQAALLDVP